jgi:hypothetical protein
VTALAVLSWLSVNACAAPSQSTRTECFSYFTFALPGDIEYATLRLDRVPDLGGVHGGEYRFTNGPWSTPTFIQPEGGPSPDRLSDGEIQVSDAATVLALQNRLQKVNQAREKEKAAFLKSAQEGPPDLKDLRETKAQDIFLFDSFNDGAAIAARAIRKTNVQTEAGYVEQSEILVEFSALVRDHIVSSYRKLIGTPQETVGGFLARYRGRAPFEIPPVPGVCTPYGYVSGPSPLPARVAASMRLLDRPDIVVYLDIKDASRSNETIKEYIDRVTSPGRELFAGSEAAAPLDRLRPLRPITIDGREGMGTFAKILRRVAHDPANAVNNPATQNIDWGYLAYVPGEKGGAPGSSFDVTVKVERYGRFAKAPMTEKEFRKLAVEIAESVKRRPGAWMPN